jgi:hypothetical protein
VNDAVSQIGVIGIVTSATTSPFAFLGNMFYFSTGSGSDFRLFRLDTVNDTVEQVDRTNLNLNNSPVFIGVLGDTLYYQSVNLASATKLFKITNSTLTPTQVNETYAGQSESPSASFIIFDGYLYYRSIINVSLHTKLFRINNSTNMPQLVGETRVGGSDSPVILDSEGDYLYYSANNSSGAPKIFRLTSSDVSPVALLVSSTNTETLSDLPALLSKLGSFLYYRSTNTSNLSVVKCSLIAR